MAGRGKHRKESHYTGLHRFERGNTSRLGRALLALLLAVPFVSHYGVGYASAGLGGDTLFAIDGDPSGPDDWEAAVASGEFNAVLTEDLCNSTGDDIVVPSTKLDDDPWMTKTGNVVDKGDLCSLWTGWDRAPDGDIIFLLGWERYGNTGEVTIYIPLDAAPFGSRTGDRLLKFEYDSNTKSITVSLLSWNGSSWGSQAVITGFAEAAVSSDTRFAEIALNVTESGLLPGDECRSFVGAFAISETGQADANPTLKDHVGLGEPIEFNSCAAITIAKTTKPVDGLRGPFTFRLTGVTPRDGQLDSGGDSVTYDDLRAGSYGLTEDDPSELLFEMASIVCDGQDLTQGGSFEVVINETYLCTITNTSLAAPSLALVKSASPSTYAGVGDVVSYSYVLTNTGNVTLSGPFKIDDDKSTDEVCPDTTTLLPSASISCTATYTINQADLDAGSVTNVATGQGFLNEQPVVSNPDTETVTVRSTPNPDPSPRGVIGDLVWEDSNADGHQGDLESGVAGVTVHLLDAGGLIIDTTSTDNGGNYSFTGLSSGTYEVQFILPAGFDLSPRRATTPANDSDADATGRTGAIALASGETDLTWDAGIYRTPEVLPQVIATTTTTAAANATTSSTLPETLPFTGSSQGGVGAVALALLIFGSVAVLAARWRKADTAVV